MMLGSRNCHVFVWFEFTLIYIVAYIKKNLELQYCTWYWQALYTSVQGTDKQCAPLYTTVKSTDKHCTPLYTTVQGTEKQCAPLYTTVKSTDKHCTPLFATVQGNDNHCTPLNTTVPGTDKHCTVLLRLFLKKKCIKNVLQIYVFKNIYFRRKSVLICLDILLLLTRKWMSLYIFKLIQMMSMVYFRRGSGLGLVSGLRHITSMYII